MKFIKYHLPVLLYAGLIFWGSSLQRIPVYLPGIDFSDLVLHFIEYFILGVLLWRSFMALPLILSHRWIIIIALLAGFIYAASDEVHQFYVPGRQASMADWAADAFGLAIGISAVYIFGRGIKKSNS